MSEVRLRARMVGVGVWSSYVLCAVTAVQVLLVDGPRRDAILALIAVALAATFAVSRLPAEAIARHPRSEGFFLAWSLFDVVFIAVIAALDGGVRSPTIAAFFLTIVFAALVYPLSWVALVSAANVVAFVVVALLPLDAVAVHDLAYVLVFAACLALAGGMCVMQARLHATHRAELARLVRADPLTGVLNRRGFAEHVDLAVAAGLPFALLQLDVDRFKAVNDTLGHAAGDRVLGEVVALAERSVRGGDRVGRLGGDEFAVLLPGAGPAEADAVRARLTEGRPGGVTVSVGRACFPADAADAEALHAIADADLYARKRAAALVTA